MDEEEFLLNCGLHPQFHLEQIAPQLSVGMLNSSASEFFFDSGSVSPNMTMLPIGSFMIKELIEKLGGIRSHYYEYTSLQPMTDVPPIVVEELIKEDHYMNLMANSISLTNDDLSPMPCDSGSAGGRAGTLNSLGSRSFNRRTNQVSDTLPRVFSSPALKLGNLPNKESAAQQHHEGYPKEISAGDRTLISSLARSRGCNPRANSTENSSLSGQKRSEENRPERTNVTNSRKRKTNPRGKGKELCSTEPASCEKLVVESGDHDQSTKRAKTADEGNGDNPCGKKNVEEKDKEDDTKKHLEAPKDYIHVRARRGQATDSHSLAERVRREKISERMKLLQDLVPGCNKVTGKALMLDEIINYVQSLQKQVEFLSMKLATVDPRMDYNEDSLRTNKMTSKPSCSVPQQMYPLHSSSSRVYGHQVSDHQHSLHETNIASTTVSPSSICLSHFTDLNHEDRDMSLPLINGSNVDVPQLPRLFEDDDLQTIVDTFLGQNIHEVCTIRSNTLHGPNEISLEKIEF